MDIYDIIKDKYKDFSIFEGIVGKTDNSDYKEKRLRCMLYMDGVILDDNDWRNKYNEIKNNPEKECFGDFEPFYWYIESYHDKNPCGGDEAGMIEHIPLQKRDFCICGKYNLHGFHPIISISKKIIIINIG